jgi:hypothetical protein
MTGHSDKFPWPPYYGHFAFFEQRMRTHSGVTNLKSESNGVYNLTTKFGKSLRIFICECYSFGAAEYVETTQTLGKFDAIVINSAWCGYTMEAKYLTRNDKVGLFKIGNFMSALNKADVWDHLTEAENETFKTNGWL